MPNRLADETSPYLLQHRNNPVDWYPWGEEALQRARAEDRPILLSIGYSACHWCHVMEHESFEDEETARLMNEHYVNIKVDREERPDLDSIYMNAVQQMTGRGGWPMTVFLRPDGAPFYGGTYFPPEAKHGLPSFRHVLAAVSDAYHSRRGDVDRSASELLDMLRQGSTLRAPAEQLDSITLGQAFRQIAARYDPRAGGFGGAPKFPQPMVLSFLLRYWHRSEDGDALAMVEHTLLRMAAGGMYDQVGGGFHRYSVDARWLVPHFEKMLYDNALLARAYLQAHLATGNPEFRRITEEVLNFVLREMQSPDGGYYSTLDADSEGEEGKFYVWTPDEIMAVLGPADGALFCRFFDVTPQGNFEGHNILHVERDLPAVAAASGVTPEALAAVITRGRELLYALRAKRIWPGLDDKILTAWNAMTIRVMAEAGFALKSQEFLTSATRNADFLLANLRRDGQLLRTYKDGVAKIDGFLEDYALLVDALVSLYQASFDPRWLSEARELADSLIANFWAPDEGIFYDALAGENGLVVRARDVNDTATPSGSSAAVMALLRLAALTGEDRYRSPAEEAIRSIGGLLAQIPHGFAEMLSALDLHLSRVSEIAIVGEPDSNDTAAMLDVLRSRYLPNAVWALRRPSWTEEEASRVTPLLTAREAIDGRATAYVCENFSCRLPVTDPALLAGELR